MDQYDIPRGNNNKKMPPRRPRAAATKAREIFKAVGVAETLPETVVEERDPSLPSKVTWRLDGGRALGIKQRLNPSGTHVPEQFAVSNIQKQVGNLFNSERYNIVGPHVISPKYGQYPKNNVPFDQRTGLLVQLLFSNGCVSMYVPEEDEAKSSNSLFDFFKPWLRETNTWRWLLYAYTFYLLVMDSRGVPTVEIPELTFFAKYQNQEHPNETQIDNMLWGLIGALPLGPKKVMEKLVMEMHLASGESKIFPNVVFEHGFITTPAGDITEVRMPEEELFESCKQMVVGKYDPVNWQESAHPFKYFYRFQMTDAFHPGKSRLLLPSEERFDIDLDVDAFDLSLESRKPPKAEAVEQEERGEPAAESGGETTEAQERREQRIRQEEQRSLAREKIAAQARIRRSRLREAEKKLSRPTKEQKTLHKILRGMVLQQPKKRPASSVL
jgi:hypothetical protein